MFSRSSYKDLSNRIDELEMDIYEYSVNEAHRIEKETNSWLITYKDPQKEY